MRAYEGQHTDQSLPADYKDNLYKALPGDRGARGRFSDAARSFSLQFWLDTRLPLVVIVSLALLLGLAVWLNRLLGA